MIESEQWKPSGSDIRAWTARPVNPVRFSGGRAMRPAPIRESGSGSTVSSGEQKQVATRGTGAYGIVSDMRDKAGNPRQDLAEKADTAMAVCVWNGRSLERRNLGRGAYPSHDAMGTTKPRHRVRPSRIGLWKPTSTLNTVALRPVNR